jgi:hypothetical protein
MTRLRISRITSADAILHARHYDGLEYEFLVTAGDTHLSDLALPRRALRVSVRNATPIRQQAAERGPAVRERCRVLWS